MSEETLTEDRTFQMKVAILGSMAVGKTTLMVKYCKGTFTEDYIATLGVQFLERQVIVKNTPISLVVWDIGCSKNYMDMLPICCDGAHAMIFMFDLTKVSSLSALGSWYKAARECNNLARLFLVGNKFDKYTELTPEQRIMITNKAKKFANAIGAPLVYCCCLQDRPVNVQKLFHLVIGSVFGLKPKVEVCDDPDKPVVIF